MRGEPNAARSRIRYGVVILLQLGGLWASVRSEGSRGDSDPVRISNLSGVWEAVARRDEAGFSTNERVMIMILEHGHGYLAVGHRRGETLVLEVVRLADEGAGVVIDFADESGANTARVLASGRLVGDSAYLWKRDPASRSVSPGGSPDLPAGGFDVLEWDATFRRQRGYICGLCEQARQAEMAIEVRRNLAKPTVGAPSIDQP